MSKISARKLMLFELLRLHFKRKNNNIKILRAANFYGKTPERRVPCFD